MPPCAIIRTLDADCINTMNQALSIDTWHEWHKTGRTAQLACLLVGLALLFSLWSQWHLWRVPAASLTPAPVPVVQQAHSTSIALDQLHLFGLSDKSVLPETNLNIKLVGAFAGPAKQGDAIIQDENGQQQTVHVGSQLNDGAVITQIQNTRVILSVNGQLQTLSMPVPSLHFGPPPAALWSH